MVFHEENSYKAISDPTRRKILQLLKSRDMSAGEITDHFNISRPSISFHLNLLKNAGLIEDRRDGQQIIYSMNTTAFMDFMSSIMSILKIGEDDDQ